MTTKKRNGDEVLRVRGDPVSDGVLRELGAVAAGGMRIEAIELGPYQREAVQAIAAAVQAGVGLSRMLLALPGDGIATMDVRLEIEKSRQGLEAAAVALLRRLFYGGAP